MREIDNYNRRPTRQWLDDVKERTGLSWNEMWRETDDSRAWSKHGSRIAPTE